MPHRIIIVARSALVFPARKPSAQFAASLDYVPGRVIWGALGARLRATPAARFGNALPSRAGDAWTRVIPATAMSCKASHGFLKDGGHGVFDTLIDRVCAEELEPAALTYDPRCADCGERADTQTGMYAHAAGDAWRTRSVQRRMLTRVAINRALGSAEPGLLYSPIALSEMSTFTDGEETHDEITRFVGSAWNLDETARTALEAITMLGGRTSSGLGRVRVTVEPGDEPAGLTARITELNRRVAARWTLFQRSFAPQANPGWSPDGWRVFTVGLQSDAILQEDGWRPTMIFSAQQLHEATGLDATLVRAQASSQIVGGWNVRWNRPKSAAVATVAGSVFLFRTAAPEPAITEALTRLEQDGIGQRRAEGFGIVRCCDEFHTEAIGDAR